MCGTGDGSASGGAGAFCDCGWASGTRAVAAPGLRESAPAATRGDTGGVAVVGTVGGGLAVSGHGRLSILNTMFKRPPIPCPGRALPPGALPIHSTSSR